jgi:hypothetical protein
MTKKRRRRRIFLETSGVLYERHGHTLMRAAVTNASSDGRVEVSNFIRMEYLRGVILNLIELYFLIKDEDSVSNALITWSQKVHQERKLKVVLMTISQWLTDQEDWRAKGKSMRRLGDEIVRLVYTFDEVYRARTRDDLRCELGKVLFPQRVFNETMLLDFYDRFRRIQRSIPRCDLCAFRARQQQSLLAQRIDLCSPARREEFRAYKGYVAQAERLEAAAATSENVPSCRWCEQVGDSIIALHMPKKATLVTADRAFLPFGQMLRREVRMLPSLAELKRQLSKQQPGSPPAPAP